MTLLLGSGALQFGVFTLKSGRESPYFFNLGAVTRGQGIITLGRCYARALLDSAWGFDVVFGPAYKGIPIATAAAVALFERGCNTSIAYNRKEAKDHGEGGKLVGEVRGKRVVIVDDILTAGTAARQSIDLLRAEGAEVVGLLVALDRQEVGSDGRSATEALAADYAVPVESVARFDDVIACVREQGNPDQLKALVAYRAQFGRDGE
ncbi:MAG: orotate phosphoribosyltransferase [Gammaproteobacteria bacterium]